MSTRQQTPKAVRECGYWLAACLQLGWRREDLDFMEMLWWRYHDDQGRLIQAVAKDGAASLPEPQTSGARAETENKGPSTSSP